MASSTRQICRQGFTGRSFKGITLAELLIAVLILGEIATFTIPKVLGSQQISTHNAACKEAVGMISGAFYAYQASNSLSASTKVDDLTQYMNYVAVQTSGTVDSLPNIGYVSETCNATSPCLKLHSGATLQYWANYTFGGTATTNSLWYGCDPDGKVTDGTQTGPGKTVQFHVYYNGRVVTRGTTEAGTLSAGFSYAPQSSYDPTWFKW